MPPSIINLEPCPMRTVDTSATGDACQKSCCGNARERPILFSAPMVRALLDGTKTQTRRVVKPMKDRTIGCELAPHELAGEVNAGDSSNCPYGQPGDRLWVRETWQFHDWTEAGEPIIGYAADNDTWLPMAAPDLSDTWAALSDPANYAIRGRACDQRWRPSIHMPRWASRIDLEITAVRVERLQDMEGQGPYPRESDALAEGVNRIHHGRGEYFYSAFRSAPHPSNWADPTDAFRELWESINGLGSWAANPWVWAIEIRRIK